MFQTKTKDFQKGVMSRRHTEDCTGGFGKDEAKRISTNLSKKLGPEFISYRTGFNMSKVAYIEGWTAISLANQIFGFNGWSSEIKNTSVDYESVDDKNISLGISCLVRITLKDGSYREDVGFGSAEAQRSKALAYEKARKEAATDALKRALRQFGNSLGNCCYDKNYIRQIQNVHKRGESDLDSSNLLRKDMYIDSQGSSRERNISFDAECLDLSDIDE